MTDLRVTNSFAEKPTPSCGEREELEQKRLAAQPIEGTAVDLTSESPEPELNQMKPQESIARPSLTSSNSTEASIGIFPTVFASDWGLAISDSSESTDL